MNSDIDFAGGWSDFWSAIKSGAGPGFTALLVVLGVAFAVVGAVLFVVSRVRKKGDGNGKVLGLVGIGVVLLAPDVILPIFLTIFDWVANTAITLWKNATG